MQVGRSGPRCARLRHSVITQAARLGFTVFELQQFSRHQDLATFQKYIDNLDDAPERIASDLGSFFLGEEAQDPETRHEDM